MIHELNYSKEFYFQWHVTSECNLRCSHCYHENYDTTALSVDDLNKIATRICNAVKVWNKQGSISITGGEPLLRKEEIFQVMGLFENEPSIEYFDLLTNGTLVDSEIVEKLMIFRKLRRIQVSLEGLEDVNDEIRGSGSFKLITSKLSELNSAGLVTSVMMTVGKHNLHQVIPLAEALSPMGVEAFIVDRFIPSGQSTDRRDWVLSALEMKKTFHDCYHWFMTANKPRMLMYRPLACLVNPADSHIGAICSAGNNALAIMPNGDVLPCRRLPIKLGNVLETTFFDIWYTHPLLWELRNPNNLKGRCMGCEHIPICRGCRAMAYSMTSDYLGEDPQCWKGFPDDQAEK